MATVVVFASTADLFSPDRPLQVVETEFFSFIFPAESAAAVAYLASFADDSYREITALLGTTPGKRIPVVMTPDSEELNGYFTWQPYLRIVLYQAPVDLNSTLGSFKDDLRKLFYHELTHAISLTKRSAMEDAVVAVFGDPMGASNYFAPLSFVEGVTVSFESRDGSGRATDPLAGAVIRQDIVEGRWKSFVQASGAYDRFPGGNLYYIYGGYFSRYLQERYGMEKYAELWNQFGAASVFKSLDDSMFGKGRFSSVYGLGLSEAWKDFKESMTPRMPVIMAAQALRPVSSISAISASGSLLYYADRSARTVFSYDPGTGDEQALFDAGFEVTRMDVSADGFRLLLSTIRFESGFPRLVLKVWNSTTGRLEDLAATGIRDAAWLDGGPSMVGIAIDGYQTDLVIIRGTDTTTLLAGTEHIGYASPVASEDGQTIHVLAREDGAVSVIRLRLSGPSGDVVSTERLVVPESLSWIRYLSLGDDGVLRFAWNDDSFYRLVELDGETLSYQTVPSSGGVNRPLSVQGRVYYLGHFSAGMAPCAFPEDRTPLGFKQFPAVWKSAPELLATTSVYDTAPGIASERYGALRWLLPQYWLPTIVGAASGIEALGLMMVVADPAERLSAQIDADWNFRAAAADVTVSATWSRFATPLTLQISDAFLSATDGSASRYSSTSIGIGETLPMFSGGTLSWSIGSGVLGVAEIVAGAPAYAPWQAAAATVEAALGWSDTTAPLGDSEARTGYQADLLARFDTPVYPTTGPLSAGVEGGLRGYLGPGAMEFSVYGAATLLDGIAYGPAGRSYPGSAAATQGLYPVWNEFIQSQAGSWFTEAEASFRVLGVELQRGHGVFYANRLSLRAGGRAFLVSASELPAGAAASAYSVFGRATLTWTPAFGAWAAIHPRSYLEFWYQPDFDTGTDGVYGLSYSIIASY